MRTISAIGTLLLAVVILGLAADIVQTAPCDSNPCANGASCVDDGTIFSCSCDVGFSGVTCRQKHTVTEGNKNYWLLTGQGTWLDFLQLCHVYGGTLATFESEVVELRVRYTPSGRIPGFIGLSSSVTAGIWRWTDTSTTVTYNMFDGSVGHDWNKKYAYAQTNSWDPVEATDVMDSAWCMDRDPQVACTDESKGCLNLKDTFELQTLKVNSGFDLEVSDAAECEAICLYSNALYCKWYYFEGTTCTLGDGTPASGSYSVYVRQVADTTEGRCVWYANPSAPYSHWYKDPPEGCSLEGSKLVNIDSESMYDKVILSMFGSVAHTAYLGLYSDAVSTWRFPSGASPYFVNWDSTNYPEGGANLCVVIESSGRFYFADCAKARDAICEGPATTHVCGNLPDGSVYDLQREIVLRDDNIRVARYTCTKEFDVMAGYNVRSTDIVCPCDEFDLAQMVSGGKVTISVCVDFDNCASNPCANGGTCHDGLDSYTCTCAQGYTGLECTSDINECISSPCINGGSCSDLIAKYECACAAGFTGDNCESNIDECQSNPCVGNAHCMDMVNGYQCHCQTGFTGETCHINIDECASEPCQNDGSCVDDVARYDCTCEEGWHGVHCELEVTVCSPNPCWNGGTCSRVGEDFNCECPEGFLGTTCETNIDECESSPCQANAHCVDGANSYHCVCPTGYTGVHCDEDIDECESSPCQNGGNCVQALGYFQCQCPSGYVGDTCDTDFDECSSSPCDNGGVCTDELDGFSCTCADGFEGPMCHTDIDDCWPTNPCTNGAHCMDGVNGFVCHCQPGFEGSTCESNIDECSSAPCANGGSCSDGVDGYQCQCVEGFYGNACETGDICDTTPCENGGSCTADGSSYTCECMDGFEGEKCDSNINDCWPASPCKNGAYCEDGVNNFTCNCQDGFEGETCETNVDECVSSPCQNEGICVDEIGKFRCHCLGDYNGTLCEEVGGSGGDDVGVLPGDASAQAAGPAAQGSGEDGEVDFLTSTTLIGIVTALALGVLCMFLLLTYMRHRKHPVAYVRGETDPEDHPERQEMIPE